MEHKEPLQDDSHQNEENIWAKKSKVDESLDIFYDSDIMHNFLMALATDHCG